MPAILVSGDEAAPDTYRDMHILHRVQSVLEGTPHARMAAHAASELAIGARPSRALPVLSHQTSLFAGESCDADGSGSAHPCLCAV